MTTTPQETLAAALAAHRAGQLAEAVDRYQTLIKQIPDSATVLTNLGSILRQQGHLVQSIELLERAIAAPGSNEHAAYNLGNAYRANGQYQAAVVAYRLAVTRKPDWPMAHCNLGVAYADVQDWHAAEQALRHALALDPQLDLARSNLAGLLSRRLMALQYQPVADESELKRLAGEYGALCPSAQQLLVAAPYTDRPLRVGLLSPDLCDHPVGLFLRPVLQQLDRQRIQPLLYSTGGRADETRRTLQALASWADVTTFNHDILLERLRQDHLDVLVDLSGHTAGHRLPVFAQRAAPYQVSWLGYFATTGLAAMDAVLMDAWHVPAGMEQQFIEPVIRLPHGRLCYQPVHFAPAVADPPSLTKPYLTFGSFNNSAKLHDGVLELWAAILQAVPHSRLVLKWSNFTNPDDQQAILRPLTRYGIDCNRIELRPFSFHVDLLKEYADLDIALDPFPFTGGLTSCEALWMGVPVVTWPHSRPVSRQTFAFLSAIGLQELAAKDADDYVRIAVGLASDPERLLALRVGLRERMRASPLMDVATFTRSLEDALIAGYRSCSG